MTCWDILQLAPTTDARAIKKAYAILLKQNRPDDNPEGFQHLHTAYQEALAWDATPAETETEMADRFPDADEEEEEVIPEFTEEEQWDEFLDLQWDELVQRVETLLNDPEQCNDPAAWHFLRASDAMLDIDFKGAFAMRFIQRMLQQFKAEDPDSALLLQPETVRYLNQLFWWSERRNQYDEYVDPILLDEFMLWWQEPRSAGLAPPPLPAQPRVPYANMPQRGLAMLIDCAGLLALGFLVSLLLGARSLNPAYALLALLAGYPLLSALFEMSPLQATPGKYWCRLWVCSPQRHRISPLHALLRAALVAVSLYFCYVTIILNLLIWDGRLLHDRLSRSVVLRR